MPVLTAIVPEDYAGQRLDQALARLFPDYSRSQLKDWLEAGRIRIDGTSPRPRTPVRGGERVEVEPVPAAGPHWAAQPLPLAIVHEDVDLIVVDKPAGLVVHPGAGNPDRTLVNALLAHDPGLAALPRAGIVHRIDKDTSGLLVVARSPRAHTRLTAALKAHEIIRTYLAVVQGAMIAGGSVDAPIGRDPQHRTRMAVTPGGGREAVTHYRVARRFRAHTLVELQLETGRTHQIRVHMAHAGFPVVGDPVYGGRSNFPRGSGAALRAVLAAFRRQALHALRLELAHPGSGTMLAFQAPVPEDMQALLAALETDDHDRR
ncbi:MAG: 23S rRNA pseudouridine(1911/1915/1917) synthase RluD [Gammaproteobacteria bacterium]